MAAQSLVGSVVGSRYRLGEPFGRGYYADVFRALDLRDGSAWAAKIYAADESGRAAAGREVEALRALVHPRLPLCRETLEADGRPVVVMEVVEGANLRAEVEHRGPLPVAEVVRIGLEACELFEHFLVLGWTYRDLHPKNVHPWTARGTMILDLDGARPPGYPPAPAGRIGYRAPELGGSEPITPACDVYSLAGCLFFALAGQDPPTESGRLPLPALTPSLTTVVDRCRRGVPHERPAIGDLRAALATARL